MHNNSEINWLPMKTSKNDLNDKSSFASLDYQKGETGTALKEKIRNKLVTVLFGSIG